MHVSPMWEKIRIYRFFMVRVGLRKVLRAQDARREKRYLEWQHRQRISTATTSNPQPMGTATNGQYPYF